MVVIDAKELARRGAGILPRSETSSVGRVTQPPDPKGLEVRRQCPRRGVAIMKSRSGKMFGVGTRCKLWACPICRKKNRRALVENVEYAQSLMGPLWLLTLTLRNIKGRELRGAEYVSQVWAAWLRLLKTRQAWRFKTMEWMKVAELTKKGQPHLHVLMIGVKKPETAQKIMRACWLEVTGDSFIVDFELVRHAGKMGNYLADYVFKGFYQRERMEAAGFSRRFSRSRGWPRGPTMVMHGTEKELWKGVGFEFANSQKEPLAGVVERIEDGHPYFVRDGDSVSREMALRHEKRMRLAILKGVSNAVNR